ncbi:MAG TPA: GNAT family N-acetyltransferase [bacterium]|nr:GNAT family N-acetyltransferase [bacterium]
MPITNLSIRPARAADHAAILKIADRLAAFGPTTRSAPGITARERRALSAALDHPAPGSALLVGTHPGLGVVGVLLLDARRDYFTDEPHGHVAILAVAQEAEGQGVGRALLKTAEEWGRKEGFRRLTLTVFAANQRAKELYARQGWQAEVETHYKRLS